MTQPIRRSQFITTYGPGAILEGPDGPRLIPTLGDSHIFDGRRATDFEITDQRLSQALLNSSGILRLPSNAEVNEPDLRYIYQTYSFPSWSLCVQHGILYRKGQQRHSGLPTMSSAHRFRRCLAASSQRFHSLRPCVRIRASG